MVLNVSSIYKSVLHNIIFVFAESPRAPISSRCALLATRQVRAEHEHRRRADHVHVAEGHAGGVLHQLMWTLGTKPTFQPRPAFVRYRMRADIEPDQARRGCLCALKP